MKERVVDRYANPCGDTTESIYGPGRGAWLSFFEGWIKMCGDDLSSTRIKMTFPMTQTKRMLFGRVEGPI